MAMANWSLVAACGYKYPESRMNAGRPRLVTTLDAYRKGGKSVRNWGRWGADGQLGMLNFIDAATLAQCLPGYGGPSEQQLVGIEETPFRWELYNGVSPSAITSRGATRLSIDAVDVKGILSRGVLRDVARHRGVENLPPNTAIAPGELDDVAAAEGIEHEVAAVAADNIALEAAERAIDGVYEFQLTALPAAARDRRRRQPDQPDRGPVRAAC